MSVAFMGGGVFPLVQQPQPDPNWYGKATPAAGGNTLYNSNPSWSLNPQPQTGSGPFGAVPGALGLPNPYGDLKKVFPVLPQANEQLGSAILSKLKGELAPETISNIQDAAARFGVSSGMPGSGLMWNRSLRDIGRATEDQIASGIAAYNQTVPTVSQTQTVNPGLQAQIAETNAINAAAPNPTEAANYAQGLFQAYLRKMRGPSSGTGAFNNGYGAGFQAPQASFSSNSSPSYNGPVGFPANPPGTAAKMPPGYWDMPRGAGQMANVIPGIVGGLF